MMHSSAVHPAGADARPARRRHQCFWRKLMQFIEREAVSRCVIAMASLTPNHSEVVLATLPPNHSEVVLASVSANHAEVVLASPAS